MTTVLAPLVTTARKASAAAIVAFLGPLGVLLAATDQPLTARTVVAAVVAGLVAGATVYGTSNDPVDKPGRHAGDRPQPTT